MPTQTGAHEHDEPAYGKNRLQTLIERPRILRRLLEAATYQIILIVAPAGFGKTTAVKQLLARTDESILITTPPSASTIGRFIHAFARGCSLLMPGMTAPPNDFSSEINSSEQQLELYSAWAIANLTNLTRCTIAIDDLQHTDGDANVALLLSRLVDRCGEQIQWIFSSRTQGYLPRTRWQAYGHADATITADDLRMTNDEACALALALRSPATYDELFAWVEQTRGFLIPLTYAIRASARRGNIDGVTEGMRSLTFHFLAEHLWHSLRTDDRALLELAALIPSARIRDYTRFGIVDAALKITALCDEIAFLTLDANGFFSMHDLFRDFVRQQILLRDENAYQQIARNAANLLTGAGFHVDAFQLLVELDDVDCIDNAIGSAAIELGNLEITARLIAATGKRAPEYLQIGTLVLQTEYWTRYGSATKALIYAEEILTRTNATSRQLLCAMRAITRFTHFQSAESHRRWLNRMPGVIQRLDSLDRTQALAYQANYFSRFQELRSEAKRLLQVVNLDMPQLDPRCHIDVQLVMAATFLILDDKDAAAQASRDAVELAQALNDPNDIARALNMLGTILYGRWDPEYENISEKARQIVVKAGAWRFSQTSHWLPSEYYARCGDSSRSLEASLLHEDVILADETQQRRFTYYRRISTIIRNLIDAKYRELLADFEKTGLPSQIEGAYHIAVSAALAYAFLENDDQAIHYLVRAKSLREATTSQWEQVGAFDIFSGELVALCLIGRWTQAKRLTKIYKEASSPSSSLYHALVLLSDGPPFAGVVHALEPCLRKPYIGLTALLAMRVVEKWSADRLSSPLTIAEKDVLRLIDLGRSNKEIALERTRSPETVKRQVASLYKKLGVENRTSAVAIARERGLL